MVRPKIPGDSEKVPASNSEKTILFVHDEGQVQQLVVTLSTIVAIRSSLPPQEKKRSKKPASSKERFTCCYRIVEC